MEEATRPMRISLTDERRQRLLEALRRFAVDSFDRELSEFQAQRLIDFFVRQLGGPVYNQALGSLC